LDPDGREIHPRGRVPRWLSWSFTAEKAGTYVLEFDNTYSILTGKSIDLALAVSPPPTTTTVYRTMIEYRTLTATEYRTEYRTLTETLTVTPSILSQESILILTLAAAVAFIAGILLTLLARRS
jgi:hypothetical protein